MNRFYCVFYNRFPIPAVVGPTTANSFNVRSLTIEDGLPQGFLTGFAQDKQGFMWIATRDGLARYDGRSVKVFQHSEADSNTISMNVIRFLSIDQEDKLWIQYDNGAIDIMDPFTEKLRRLAKRKALQPLPPQALRIAFPGSFRTAPVICIEYPMISASVPVKCVVSTRNY